MSNAFYTIRYNWVWSYKELKWMMFKLIKEWNIAERYVYKVVKESVEGKNK